MGLFRRARCEVPPVTLHRPARHYPSIDLAERGPGPGRPDLAGAALDRVSAPTLLLVGDRAPDRVASNRRAEERLGADSRLELVPGADDLLYEVGARRHAWRSATEWLELHLADAVGSRSSPLAGILR